MGAAHTALATCLEALGDLKAAVANYEAGIDLGSRTPDAYAGLGDTLAAIGRGTPKNPPKKNTSKAPAQPAASRKSKKANAAAAAAAAASEEQDEAEAVEYLPPTSSQLHARAKAVGAYQKALDLDPYHGPALYGSALCLAALQDYGPAIAAFRRANALKAHDRDATFLAAYGISCVRRLELDAQGKAPAPVRVTAASEASVAAKGSKAAGAAGPLGEAGRRALWAEAAASLERCVSLNGSYEAYLALAAVKLDFEANPDAALLLVQKAAAVDATQPHAHVSAAKVLASRGQHDAAITAFLTALGLVAAAGTPEEAELAASIKPSLAACYVAKGQAAAAASASSEVSFQAASEAEVLFQSALSHDPTSAAARAGLSDALFWRANAADDEAMSSGGGADAAVRLYAASLKQRPGHGACYMRMGLALERNGLLTEAAACMEKAVKFDPSLADAHRALGRLSTEAEDIAAALEQACRLVPDDYDLRVQYGAALVEVPETLLFFWCLLCTFCSGCFGFV